MKLMHHVCKPTNEQVNVPSLATLLCISQCLATHFGTQSLLLLFIQIALEYGSILAYLNLQFLNE